jgi:two-component system, OmpR family, sensor histidine kinase ChvG
MKPRLKWAKKRKTSIAWLLLFFNMLLIFVPIASFLSLKSYEKSLLDSLEHALVQQGRFLAAWLSVSELDRERATATVGALRGKHTARIRVVDAQGRLLADSSSMSGASALVQNQKPAAENALSEVAPQESWIYGLFSLPVRVARKYFLPPQPKLESADYYGASPSTLIGEEIQAALQGRYGAATRISSGEQVSVTLYSAVPILSPLTKEVSGAVLVSQSTFRILIEIYGLRVQVGRIFLFSLFAALALTLLLSLFVLRPVRLLSKQARDALTPLGLSDRPFSALRRRDEIGELSQALSEFSLRLKNRLDWAERFSQDAAHELKNPIASMRAAAELLEGSNEAEKRRISRTIAEEAFRMERIVEGLRRLSRLDSDRGQMVKLDPEALIRNMADRHSRSGGAGVEVSIAGEAGGRKIRIDPDRLVIALDTLLENAESFSPEGAKIGLRLAYGKDSLTIVVEDSGPGIPPENMDKIFGRFFSYRPEESELESHAGLGLSIAKAVADGSGGSLEAENRESGGARFILRLPFAKKP